MYVLTGTHSTFLELSPDQTISSIGFESTRIINSSRLAVGGGVSMGTPMGRFELTYAVPLRYGPKDARKHVQMGFSFSFG